MYAQNIHCADHSRLRVSVISILVRNGIYGVSYHICDVRIVEDDLLHLIKSLYNVQLQWITDSK